MVVFFTFLPDFLARVLFLFYSSFDFFGYSFVSLQQLAGGLLIYHGWLVVTLFWTQLGLCQKQTELLAFS
jgi:hypothetical protein